MPEQDEIALNAVPSPDRQTAREFLHQIQFIDLTTGIGQYESYHVQLRADQLEHVRKLIAQYVASDLEAKAKALRGDG